MKRSEKPKTSAPKYGLFVFDNDTKSMQLRMNNLFNKWCQGILDNYSRKNKSHPKPHILYKSKLKLNNKFLGKVLKYRLFQTQPKNNLQALN